MCEEHKWEGDDWYRETATRWDGSTFTYIVLKRPPPPSGWEGRIDP